MLNRCRVDESGIALPVAIMLIVLVGVMGAGLLTFVSTDLNTVVEVNQGQRAFELADTGVQSAKRQLTSNPAAADYDGTGSESRWSYSVANTDTRCTAAGSAGICLNDLNLDGNTTTDLVNVTIQNCAASGANCTPAPADASKAFKVLSTGVYGNAKRRIEAVFALSSGTASVSLPAQLGTTGNIILRGNLNLKDQLMFAGKDILLSGSKPTLTGSVGMFAGGNFDWVNYNGPDAPSSNTSDVWDMFKNWKTQTKNVANPRPYPDSQNKVPLGIGAVGKIGPQWDWNNACSSVSGVPDSGIPSWSPMRNDASIRYFDKCSTRKFVENPASSSQITFPFDTYRGTDGLLYYGSDRTAQAQLIETLRAKAQANGTYFTPASYSSGPPFLIAKPGFTGTANLRWPSPSTVEDTVVFVSFTGNPTDANTVKTQFENSCSAPFNGTLIVENGNLLMESSMDALNGAVIVRKSHKADGTEDSSGKGGKFTSKGSCINGYVWADKEMDIQSNTPTFGTDVSKLPGFSGGSSFSVQMWRECYSSTANTC